MISRRAVAIAAAALQGHRKARGRVKVAQEKWKAAVGVLKAAGEQTTALAADEILGAFFGGLAAADDAAKGRTVADLAVEAIAIATAGEVAASHFAFAFAFPLAGARVGLADIRGAEMRVGGTKMGLIDGLAAGGLNQELARRPVVAVSSPFPLCIDRAQRRAQPSRGARGNCAHGLSETHPLFLYK